MAFPDVHKNFAYSTVLTAPSPGDTGTSLVVQSGDGTKFPAVPFNATVWPAGAQPTGTTATIVRVTAISTDTFTLSNTPAREFEGSAVRTIGVGDQIAAAITAKTIQDMENDVGTWSPFILASAGTGLQTLARSSGSSSSGSMIIFPMSVPVNMHFNQILLANSLSYITSATGGVNSSVNNSYYSYFGIYSRSVHTFNLISSNSFSIGETVASVSLTWNYPTSTSTQGYGYGSFPAGNLTAAAQMSSYIQSTRVIGLQFGGNMTLQGGEYFLGILTYRSTGTAVASSAWGLSHAGLIGQIINPIDSVGSQSGLLPFGIAPAEWTNFNSDITAWLGRRKVGILTNQSIPNYGGTAIPSVITLSQIANVAGNLTMSVLPTVTFVST